MKKNLMDDSNYRNYEYGKMTLASEVNKMLEEAIKNKTSLKELTKKFKKTYSPYIASFGKTKPTKFELKFNYIETYKYRGFKIKVFDDDYGQQYYFYFNKRCIGCGTYNFNYKECIKYEVDHYLDDIFNFSNLDKKYAGAFLQYNNHEHTEILFTYRMEEIGLFYSEQGFDIEYIKNQCVETLDKLFASEEFQKSEAERKAKGDLYFSELCVRKDFD